MEPEEKNHGSTHVTARVSIPLEKPFPGPWIPGGIPPETAPNTRLFASQGRTLLVSVPPRLGAQGEHSCLRPPVIPGQGQTGPHSHLSARQGQMGPHGVEASRPSGVRWLQTQEPTSEVTLPSPPHLSPPLPSHQRRVVLAAGSVHHTETGQRSVQNQSPIRAGGLCLYLYLQNVMGAAWAPGTPPPTWQWAPQVVPPPGPARAAPSLLG